jgi:hypothetical protein
MAISEDNPERKEGATGQPEVSRVRVDGVPPAGTGLKPRPYIRQQLTRHPNHM